MLGDCHRHHDAHRVSLDADPDAEMLILLNGIHALTAANFSL